MPYDFEDQPNRAAFKRRVKDLESWIGKEVKTGLPEHFIDSHFHNLTPWSSYWFLWLIDSLNRIKNENLKIFRILVEKLSSNDFSWEASEIITEIAFLQRVIPIQEIEIDPKMDNDLNPDILFKSQRYGETIIEVSRLQDSEESLCSQRYTENLRRFMFGTSYLKNCAYKFSKRPSEKEWVSFLEVLTDQLSNQTKYIINKNSFVTFILGPDKPPDYNLFAALCEEHGLNYGEMSGWPILENTPFRIKNKIKKKYKYYGKGKNYILSLYGLNRIFFFYGQKEAEKILKTIASECEFPIKFNYWFMFKRENVTENLNEFTRIQLKIPESITMCSYFDKEYVETSVSKHLFNDLLQNFG